MSSGTVIIGIATKPSSLRRAITTEMLTMIADLLLSTNSNQILTASIMGPFFWARNAPAGLVQYLVSSRSARPSSEAILLRFGGRTFGCSLTAAGASLDARPGRSPAGASCRGDGCRGGDAAAIQSADILSWWHFRVARLCDALLGKSHRSSRCARLRVETPSATGCASPAAYASTPRCRSALDRTLGDWHARGCCSRLVSARRELGDEVARGHTSLGSPSGGSKKSDPGAAKDHPTSRGSRGQSCSEGLHHSGSS